MTPSTSPVSEKHAVPAAAKPPPAKAASASAHARPSPAPAPTVTWSWRPILERCRDAVRADSVIAIDSEGLAVAWVGPLDAVQADRVAAHVSKSFDLLDQLKYVGRLAECMCVKFEPEGSWLTAVRVAPKVSTVVTVVVLGPFTLVHTGRDRLRTTFLRLLEATRIP